MSTLTDGQALSPQAAGSPFALLCGYAEAVAKNEVSQEQGQDIDSSYLAFSAGGEYFLIKVQEVRSVLSEVQSVTRLPFSPPWLLGLTSVRSEIMSIISFAELWNPGERKKTPYGAEHYILLGGVADGFLLKVDGLHGMSSAEVEPFRHQKRFIDGRANHDGKSWQRINLETLLETELTA